MISRFFTPALPSTRLNNCKELSQIPYLANKLSSKVDNLKNDAGVKGVGSVDHRKYLVMAAILNNVQDRITLFNQPVESPNAAEMLALVSELCNIVSVYRANNAPILAWPRNNNREMADASLAVGIYGGSLVVATVLPFTFIGTLLAFFAAAPWMHNQARTSSGLKNTNTASMQLIDEWLHVLNELRKSFEFKVEPSERLQLFLGNDCPEQFNCPITLTMMHDPCICALDGVTYERSAITESLTKFRKSLKNNVELPAGMEVNTVLFPNLNLKDLIDRYQQQKELSVVSRAPVPHF